MQNKIPDYLRRMSDEQLLHSLIITDTWLCREAAKRLAAYGHTLKRNIRALKGKP